VLLSVMVPGGSLQRLKRGFARLSTDQTQVPAAVGFALFDAPSHLLPRSGLVEVRLVSPLDGRPYALKRAIDVAEHWQAEDLETGWLAASGATDTAHWVHQHLDVPVDLPLPLLFRDVVSFSLPVTMAWLLEEDGLRERKLAEMLRTERYPAGLRWLNDVLAEARAEAQAIEAEFRLLEGRDALLGQFQERFESARLQAIQTADQATTLAADASRAETEAQRFAALQADLDELRNELQARTVRLARLEAEAEHWNHWQSVRDRAERAMDEHRADWQAYQDATAEIGRLESELAGADALRVELQAAAGEVLALQRERALLESQVAAVEAAETAAAELGEAVQHQQQLEQQIGANQERALRLELANRALQQALADSKRIELVLGGVERQITDLEQLGPQAAKLKRLQNELEDQQRRAREAARQVDHLRFLEAAVRAIGGHLDELRKGASVTERMTARAGAGGNGSGGAQDRTLAGHLRQAVDHQVEALDRQLKDWQAQIRDLADAPSRLNQLRSTVHQLEQEIGGVRQVEIKLSAAAALKQHRKHLRDRFEQLKKLIDAQLKEQKECSDAPARLSQLRQELSALNDPRAEREAQLRTAARKRDLEAALKQVQHKLVEGEDRQASLERRMQALATRREALAAQERKREEAHDGYCTYLAQQAVAELAASFHPQLEQALARLEAERSLQSQAESRQTALLAAIAEVQDAPVRAAALQARVADAQAHALEWKNRYQDAAEDLAAAQGNREELKRKERELSVRRRAYELLIGARGTMQETEKIIGTELRQALAVAAGAWLRYLAGDPEVDVAWRWGEAPVLVRGGAEHPLDELSPVMQACCALALRLALASDASRFGTLFLSDLGALQESEEFTDRLQRLEGFDQLLVSPA